MISYDKKVPDTSSVGMGNSVNVKILGYNMHTYSQ